MGQVKQQKEVYRCAICGNMVEVIRVGGGELVCCGQPMNLEEGKNEGTGAEKHLPVANQQQNELLVKVGEVLHPMEDSHFIEWIELQEGAKVIRQFLEPGKEPKAKFSVSSPNWQIRAYCNQHGLWQIKS
ncbi:desulfoferrodoxin [Candidatus Parcubacteria bacterium]|nr:MAG: desulfoferrodoxin [Candidatus Parcubacteria bacterium]